MLVSACPRECKWLSVLVSDYDGFDCGKGRKILGYSPEMMVQSPDLPTYLIRFGPFVSMAALQNYRPNFGTTTCYSYCTEPKFLSFQPPASSSRRRSRVAVASKARADAVADAVADAAAARTRADAGGAAEGGRSSRSDMWHGQVPRTRRAARTCMTHV